MDKPKKNGDYDRLKGSCSEYRHVSHELWIGLARSREAFWEGRNNLGLPESLLQLPENLQ
jgi:hypothetical protein